MKNGIFWLSKDMFSNTGNTAPSIKSKFNLITIFVFGVLVFGTSSYLFSYAYANSLTLLDKKLIQLRENFTKLRIESDKAKKEWLEQHNNLLSIEDLQIAYQNLIDLSKLDLDVLALNAIGINRNLIIPQKSYQNQYSRYFIKEVVTTDLQQQLARGIASSQESLDNLVADKEGILSEEQSTRLKYYKLEKILDQTRFQMKKKKLALIKYDTEDNAYRSKINSDSDKVGNLRVFLDKIDEPSIKQSYDKINWPNSIQQLEDASDITLSLKGDIIIQYNQKDESGAKISGIKISALGKDIVHSPYDGLIAFAGKFKNVGNIVIITHRERWYSILTGLDKLFISAGQLILTNEPIGEMKGKGAILYQELRRGKLSVNPRL